MVYSRREKVIPKSVHTKESNLPPLCEVTISNPINFCNCNEFVYENLEA